MSKDTSEQIKNGDKVTVRELYELVDHKVGEVNTSIQRLEGKFDALEAGRLTRLEGIVATLTAEVSAKKDQDRIFVGIIAFVISTAIAIMGIIFRK